VGEALPETKTSLSAETRYWESVGEEWDRTHPDALWRRHCDAVNLRLLARWLPAIPVTRLLKTDLFDEAVSGGLQALLQTRARVVVGMDLSRVTARVARARCPDIQAVCTDARRLPFSDGAFDVIVSDSTLDHFHTEAELVGALRELQRVTRPGGVLLLTLDNPANPVIALRNALPFRLLNRLGIVPYYVGATAGPRRLRCLLEQTGWEIRQTGAIMHCLRVAGVMISRIVERRTGRETHERLLRWLMRFESWEHLPTRFLTGHFVAVLATPVRAATTRSP